VFGRHLKEVGTKLTLAVGASFQPTCANEGGCELPPCQGSLACRAETANTLDVFVMSQCPFGVQALNTVDEVLRNFKGTPLTFHVNYIASGSTKGGFQSLHGPAEVEEDLRELCAMKKYPKDSQFMSYVLCRNRDIRSLDWEKCAVSGIDAKVIKACAEGDEGKTLLEESLALSSGLHITASPTWLVNGKYKFSGVDAETIKRNICGHNATLKGTAQGGCTQ